VRTTGIRTLGELRQDDHSAEAAIAAWCPGIRPNLMVDQGHCGVVGTESVHGLPPLGIVSHVGFLGSWTA
jgi:hypothetical protein